MATRYVRLTNLALGAAYSHPINYAESTSHCDPESPRIMAT